ncbi:hypothetical protein FTV88_0893 [Heliorestis convoluta]|uniref:Uncharacterized protein n=1 Tax=Heliorestis convoluta TaxID=356322 RepID=A0A5Q2MZX3_9FIRM|nr:hypothetical protein FTV88_0893 [Heliorestis convoluta]
MGLGLYLSVYIVCPKKKKAHPGKMPGCAFFIGFLMALLLLGRELF